MFTGIVEEVGKLVERRGAALRLKASRVLEGTRVGDSIAVNGACLTVTSLEEATLTFDITPETERRTNLGFLTPGSPVNLERSLAYGGRMGGHLVQGHVDGVGRVLSITPEGDSHIFRFEAPAPIMRYVVEKGFMAVDGISLTVTGQGDSWFTVAVIPYTFRNTGLGSRKPGDVVNLEVDILAKYLERLLRGEGSEASPYVRGASTG
ncbi:MAG: riboflavin synthase [Chloroflexi bacterium]|nr:riboflavin synthase [Chloroflexota bacterium]